MAGFVPGLLGVSPAVPRRRRLQWARLVGPVAALLGTLLRLARPAVRFAPGAAGALLVSVGAWLAWPPAGLIVAGLLLLAMDRAT